MQLCTNNIKNATYYQDDNGAFIIENYNEAKPLSSFLPGIAGIFGIPMWVFYVNRGQCIASMGITNKDNAILEFFPANRAYQLTPLQGYRTFIKIGPTNPVFYEPFQNNLANQKPYISQKMIITSHDLKLIDRNEEIGLETTVHYFTIPHDTYSGLCRIVSFKNTSSRKFELNVLDGLPHIISHGLIHIIQKDLSRTAEAWVEVVNNEYNAPLFRLKAVIADKPEVQHIPDGHFYFTFKDDQGLIEQAQPIIDPSLIFGHVNDFSYPSKFINSQKLQIPVYQKNENLTPCAFGFHTFTLNARQTTQIYSVMGHIGSIHKLNGLVRSSMNPRYFKKKAEENRYLIEEIQQKIATVSSSKEYNLYSKQTFLDNVLRGGLPITLQTGNNKKIFHVYSRKHGDLERDYNKFSVLPTPFSQGNGNYRDINQNRRNDIWFNPDVTNSNIETFINLIQMDGYNPLVIKGCNFTFSNADELQKVLHNTVKNDDDKEELKIYLAQPFTPGDLLKFVDDKEIFLNVSPRDFINNIIAISDKNEESEHGEGFWTDHWTYCLDLIESYLSVYPEKLRDLLCEKNDFVFYHNQARIAPRARKYVLRHGKPFNGYAIEGVASQEEWRKKEETLEGINTDAFKLKTRDGKIYSTTLMVKLMCIIANMMATLDPKGIGIEMEAGKPNWYDALNGLPGLFGSSIHETFELKRLILFVVRSFDILTLDSEYSITFPSELYVFIKELGKIVQKYAPHNSDNACFEYWDKASSIKEHYRATIIHDISGDELEFSIKELKTFLHNAVTKIDHGIKKSRDSVSELYNSYFINEITEYDSTRDPRSKKKLFSPDGFPYIKPTKFIQKPLPLFLEAQVHAMRVLEQKEVYNLYMSVRRSPLYDRELMMYKVNASLVDQPEEIGRCRLFTPGWLENESIWTHMEYKYLLELLKNNLFDEFYTEFQKILIPFLDAEKYGRSTTENSSFIVSSANPDESLHGNGFIARLSGATAEFIHMWILMNVGKNPFFVNKNGELNFTFKPALAGWLFTEQEAKETLFQEGEKVEYTIQKNSYAFMLLGKTFVIYENQSRKNTFGTNSVKPSTIHLTLTNGQGKTIEGDTLPDEYATSLRNGEITLIHVTLS